MFKLGLVCEFILPFINFPECDAVPALDLRKCKKTMYGTSRRFWIFLSKDD